MKSFITKLWRDRRGTALVIAGAAMPLVVGAAGLAVDTIQWTLWKRQLQRAADSAAIAGVYAKIQGQARDAAITTDLAKNNHVGTLLTAPAVSEPVHATGLWTNGVAVRLSFQKKLNFSSMFMSSPPVISAQATAATIRTGVYCVISLEDTSETGIKASGNGHLDLGCGLITNSTSLTAAIATGSSTLDITTVAAVGDVTESNNWGSAELLPFTVKQPDPFGDITPDTSDCPSVKVDFEEGVSGPGCYSSMTFSNNTTLTPGVYIIDGGDLRFGSSAHVTCTGCTFVLTNSDSTSSAIGSLDVVGSPELDLSGSTTGTYSGILMFQDRRAPAGSSKVNKIVGDANSVISGAFYFPNQQLHIGGNALMTFTCGQFVARTVEFIGNGGLTNNCTTPPNEDDFMGQHVRLVA